MHAQTLNVQNYIEYRWTCEAGSKSITSMSIDHTCEKIIELQRELEKKEMYHFIITKQPVLKIKSII